MRSILDEIFIDAKGESLKNIVERYEAEIWEYLWDEKGYMWEYGDDG